MKFLILIINIFLLILQFKSFSQNTVTKEFYSNGQIRRTLIYNENLELLSEIYFRQKNSKQIAKIEYKNDTSFKNVKLFDEDGIQILYEIDFENGKYIDTKNQIVLSFKDNFVFEGKQIGNHIIAHYKNNKREGPVLQYDSTATGKVLSNKVFAEYEYKVVNDKAYITHTILHPIYEDTFSLYKGAFCNFENDILNGKSNFFSAKGYKTIESFFNKGKCLYYNSYDTTNNIISKISGKDGMINRKAIINGSIKEFGNNNLIWFYSIESIGEIYAEYEHSELDKYRNYEGFDKLVAEVEERNSELQPFQNRHTLRESVDLFKKNNYWNVLPKMKVKKVYDSLLHSVESITDLKKILGIPYFYIRRFNFDNFDKDNFVIIPLSSYYCIDSNGITKTLNDTIHNYNGYNLQNLNEFENQLYWNDNFGMEMWSLELINRIRRFNIWLKLAFNFNRDISFKYCRWD